MEKKTDVREILNLSPDPRVRVFRRMLTGMEEEFEGIEVDAYAVIGAQYVILLDTLLCPEDAQQLIEALTPALVTRQLLCVNSHADWDHAWGNGYFNNGEDSIPIIAHELCRKRMLSPGAQQELDDYQARYPIFARVSLEAPTLTFRDTLTIHDPALTIELLHAPGHCREQIAAWFPELRLLLAFDAVEWPLPCIEDASGVPLMFATLERLVALDATCVLCSHGNTSSPTLIQENLAYLREIERRSRLLLARQTPTETDLERAADLIAYPLGEILPDANKSAGYTYFSWAHEHNAQAILRWLMAN